MQIIRQRAYARAGLIGNPSDGYNGKTIAFSVRNFYAQVVLYEWPTLEILPGINDTHRHTSISDLHSQIVQHGYYGGIRLIKATIKVFVDYCRANQLRLHERNFAIRYLSTIPQQVGLAGSSAIITATLRALKTFYDITIDERVQPSLVLSVERQELGIQGGLQDRVVQTFEGLVAMDFSTQVMQKVAGFDCGHYERMDSQNLPPLYLAYRPASSEPTEVFHNNLRTRYDSGEKDVVDAMAQFARLTDMARRAIEDKDTRALSHALDANFDLRASICTLNPAHVEMINTARQVGVSAKYVGSGGAILGVCEDDATYQQLQTRLNQLGCVLVRPVI